MIRGAQLSPCGRYRYSLERRWGSGPAVLFVMLNPSTADGLEDDPTIRRCVGFAQRWGAGSLHVTNLFAHRATKPEAVLRIPDVRELEGPDYWTGMREVLATEGLDRRVVCAWGAHGSHLGKGPQMLAHLRAQGFTPVALSRTKDGSPGHPLYLPASSERIPL